MMQRRTFLRVALTGAGALFVGVQLQGCTSPEVRRMQQAAERGVFRPSVFVTIHPDDRVDVGVGKAEMGQGTYGTYAWLVAEELEVDPARITLVPEAGPAFQNFGVQVTGGSTSTAEAWDPLRTAGATARLMLTAAAAQTWKVPLAECHAANGLVIHRPTDRRLRYGELITAAARLPIPEDVPLKKPDDFQIIGRRLPRVDLHPKVTGAPIFGLDVDVPDMVRALVIHPPVIGATVASYKADAARQEPGVIDIIPIESGLAVIAAKYWQARRAAAKVEVVWDEGHNARLDSAALHAATVERSAGAGMTHRREGDPDEAIAGPRIIEAVYAGPFLAHAPLEPQNATAHVEPGRRVRIWAPTQFQSGAQDLGARIGDVAREQVELHTTYLGGGFGRRGVTDAIKEALQLSKRVGRPVQVIWSREDDTRGGYYRPLMLARMKAALAPDGKPTAFHAHALSKSVFALGTFAESIVPEGTPADVMVARALGQLPATGTLADPIATEGIANIAYRIPHIRVDYTPIRVDVPVTFWRSVGHSVNAFAVEGFVDELAHAAGADPVEYRRAILPEDSRERRVLDAAATLGRWGTPLEPGWGRGIAVHASFGSYCAQVIEAGVFDGEIRVRRVACAIDCGIRINPDQVEAQMESCIVFGLSAALWQRIDIERGRVRQGNFDDYPLMRLDQTPEIAVTLIDSNMSPTGVGEPGMPPVAPALAAALFAATGKRLRTLPLADALREVT